MVKTFNSKQRISLRLMICVQQIHICICFKGIVLRLQFVPFDRSGEFGVAGAHFYLFLTSFSGFNSEIA